MYIGSRQTPVGKIGKQPDARFQQIRKKCTDYMKGQIEHQTHNGNECGNSSVFPRQDPVNPPAPGMLPALPGLDHCGGAYLLNKPKAHIRNGSGTVQSPFLFHLHHNMLQAILFIFIQLQLLQHIPVTAGQLGGGKPQRDARIRSMILYETHNAVNAPVHCAAAAVGITEILPARPLLIFRHMQRMIDQLVDALIFRRRNGHHRHSQSLLHFIDENGAAVLPHLIHHIQRHHHGHIQLQQLHGQVQIPLNVGGVYNVDDAPGPFLENKLPGDNLLTAVGRHGVNARQVGDPGIGVPQNLTILPVHRNAGKVSHMLVGAGQPVKQGGLSTVLIAHQRKGQHLPLRQGAFSCLGVIFPPFSQARVGNGPQASLSSTGHGCGLNLLHRDLVRICQPKGQLIAVHPKLQRIPHGCKLHQRYLRIRDQSHIQKVLPQGAFSPYGADYGGFSDC